MKIPDNKIIEELSKGNQKVFDDLFRCYYQSLCIYARRYLSDMDLAEELVQDIFVKFWEKRNSIQQASTIKTYLYTSVRNRCIDYIRKENVKKKYANEVINNSTITNEPEILPDKELINQIKKAIKQLPKQRRKIFQMNRFYGLKYKEIALKLNLSPKTVENQIGIALKQLRELLKDIIPIIFIVMLKIIMILL